MATLAVTASAPLDTRQRGERARRMLLWAYAGLFYCFLYLPILLLVVLSFNDSQTIGLPFQGVTLRWYEEVLGSPEMLRSILNSVVLGVVSAAVATLLALLLALGFRQEFPLKGLLMKIILLPILIPGIVGGVIYLVFFGFGEVQFGVWTTALPVHITWVLPFAFLTLFPRIHGLDRSLEEAAADLGARPLTVFRRVVFPIIKPGVVATAMFAFTLSFDEFIRTLFVIGNQRTVPVHLWTLLSDQMAPFLPAVGVVITVISMLVSFVGFAASARAGRAH
ncbi:ABC transporter permease [Enterovirga aerilata]|uniref:ABC transporter permease n=1 Tax=Enterovirga aerilata TaxID=2730920 RepID=A0A849ID83_9HYPH|nr:ABC transporter permease [Enterovirga sp. DB1703]NNM74185.1 ABC transporter permease [Enterovirga sp. DB1703]